MNTFADTLFCKQWNNYFCIFSLRTRAELAMHSWDKLNRLQLMSHTWPHREITSILSTNFHYLVVDIVVVVVAEIVDVVVAIVGLAFADIVHIGVVNIFVIGAWCAGCYVDVDVVLVVWVLKLFWCCWIVNDVILIVVTVVVLLLLLL